MDEDRIDYDLLEDLLACIDEEQGEGAILVFLPGGLVGQELDVTWCGLTFVREAAGSACAWAAHGRRTGWMRDARQWVGATQLLDRGCFCEGAIGRAHDVCTWLRILSAAGMGEITALYERLAGSRRFRSGSHWLLPLHSTVSPSEQRQASPLPWWLLGCTVSLAFLSHFGSPRPPV